MLLIGIGNSSRRDDGLGWAFLDEIKKMNLQDVELVYKYQLNIEDAEMITEADKIIFVDAFSGDLENGFSFEKCMPVDSFEFTTHALSPGVIVSLCQNLYDRRPNAFVLKIKGHEWELKKGLSKPANKNLQNALDYFLKNIAVKIETQLLSNSF